MCSTKREHARFEPLSSSLRERNFRLASGFELVDVHVLSLRFTGKLAVSKRRKLTTENKMERPEAIY